MRDSLVSSQHHSCHDVPHEETVVNTSPFDNVIDTKIVVLMDEAEEKRPTKVRVSSVPILRKLKLHRCSIHPIRATKATPPALLQQWADFSSPHTALLYPSESSTTLDFSHSIHQYDQHSTVCRDHSGGPSSSFGHTYPSGDHIHTLVVLDGSWRTVQQLLYHNPPLQPQNLRHVRLDVSATYTSYYHRSGLRQEPAPNCVSTAEAVGLALLRLEAPSNTVGMLLLNSFKNFVKMSTTIDRIEDDVQRVTSPSVVEDDKQQQPTSSVVERNPSGANGFGSDIDTDINDDFIIQGKRKCDDSDLRCDADNSAANKAQRAHGDCLLLPSKGVKEKIAITKSQKRKHNRMKEKKKKRRK